MNTAPSADAYPHRTALLGPVCEAPILVVFIDGATPDAEAIASIQDAIEMTAHVVLAARTAAGLESAEAAALHIAQHTKPPARH